VRYLKLRDPEFLGSSGPAFASSSGKARRTRAKVKVKERRFGRIITIVGEK